MIGLFPTAATPSNPVDEAQFFVRQNYIDFLARNPDDAGFAFWTNEITSCGTNAACIDAKRTNVSAAFFLSIEFQETGYLVYRFYKVSYGRLPLLNEMLPDTRRIGSGVIVNAPGWQIQLENNKVAFADAWINRTSFKNIFSSKTNTDFVDTLFANAGITPTQADKDSLINSLNTGSISRAAVVRRVAENQNLKQLEFNKAFVLMEYFGYLLRNPNDAPDGDFKGFNFWLNKLNQFSGNYVAAEMVRAFLLSAEYRARFIPAPGTTYVLYPNRNDPLLLRASIPNGDSIEYFGQKNDSGIPTSLDGFRIKKSNGDVNTYILDSQRRISKIQSSNGVLFNFNWVTSTNVVVTALAPDGKVEVNVALNLMGQNVLPPSLSSGASGNCGDATVEVKALTVLPRVRLPNGPQPEVSRFESSPASSDTIDSPPKVEAATTMQVTVNRCGVSVDNASVDMGVTSAFGDYSLSGHSIGNGAYAFSLPTIDPNANNQLSDKCESAANVADWGCTALDALGPVAEVFLCPTTGAAIALIPGAEPAGALIASACQSAMNGFAIYCKTLGASPSIGAPSIASLLCPLVSTQDRFAAGSLQLRPVALIPGTGFVIGPTATVPANGPFPNLVIAPLDQVTIQSFSANPSSPGEGVSYVATAVIQCASKNTSVTITISGTDGYGNSTTCSITGNQSCALGVPGALSGVVDTLTVKVQNGPSRTIVNVFR